MYSDINQANRFKVGSTARSGNPGDSQGQIGVRGLAGSSAPGLIGALPAPAGGPSSIGFGPSRGGVSLGGVSVGGSSVGGNALGPSPTTSAL